MNGKDVLGLIFANTDDDVISEVTGVRSMASVPFGGAYRLVDFVLSNMVNAGVTKVGVVTNNNYQSLMDHIGTGKNWDLSRKNDGIYFLPPFNAEAVENYNASRIGALKNILHFLEKSNKEYVFMTDCTYVANLDLNEIFEYHEKSGCDMTQLYMHGKTPAIKDNPVLDKIEDGKITKMSLGTGEGKTTDFALKAIIIKKSLLESLVSVSYAKGLVSFEKDIIMKNLKKLSVGAYEVKGFCKVIDSLASYFDANFSLLDSKNYRELFNRERPVYTKVYDDMPTVYAPECDVKNSLIADGCIIDGEVENCIIFRDCRVEKGAVVKNSILMPHGFVAEDASVNYCIADKAVTVRSGKHLSGADSYPVYIGKNIHI